MSEVPDFWARRPLSASQTRYAALDAALLLPLHSRLLLEIELNASLQAEPPSPWLLLTV